MKSTIRNQGGSMPQYVLVNRRSGMFTKSAKISSRATVPATLGLLTSAKIVADNQPADPLARQVVLLDADPGQVAALQSTLPADYILEPAVRRNLHRLGPRSPPPARACAVASQPGAAACTRTGAAG